MDPERDDALESLDRGFQESKNMQLLQFLNDQADISQRLKTCRFKETTNDNGTFNPDARVSTAPEGSTRTHRLRPLSARPSTASGRQYQEPEANRNVDFDNMSVVGRRQPVVRKHYGESSSSSSLHRPETVCGFVDIAEEEEEEDDDEDEYQHELESDLDLISIESITSTSPCDDIDDDDANDVTYEFDVPESDRRHIEHESRALKSDVASALPTPSTRSPTRIDSPMKLNSPTRVTSPKRTKSSKYRSSVPNISSLSSKSLSDGLSIAPQPPPTRLSLDEGVLSEPTATSKVLRHMRARSSSTDLKERGRIPSSLSKGFVWGDSNVDDHVSATLRQTSDRTGLVASPMSPRISFEELPIEKQGMKLRTVARIDCDASFYRKLRHRSAPAMRTDELTTSRSEGNSPVRVKPVGIYHLPPLSKESTMQPQAPHRTLATTEFSLAQPQPKVMLQEPNLLH